MAMSNRLAGKVAIVTGAGTVAEGMGNGKATALLLAREGARIAAVDLNRAAAETTAEGIRKGRRRGDRARRRRQPLGRRSRDR